MMPEPESRAVLPSDKSYKFSWDELRTSYKDSVWEERVAEVGDMVISQVRGSAGWTAEDTFAGLPDDMCQAPHWGVVLRGKVRIVTKDGAIDCEPGDAYYQAVPHRVEWLEDSVLIEFTPSKEFWFMTDWAEKTKKD
jgi:hypothetical protein